MSPDGTPSGLLAAALDDLLEASIPGEHKNSSAALAVDWTDVETFSRPPPPGSTCCADPEASWGHRNSNLPGPKGEMFFGYYLSAATMVREEHGPPVPELTRRMTLTPATPTRSAPSPRCSPACPPTGSPSATSSPTPATPTATPQAWALPLRAAGAQLVQDLHPHDRGPQGTHHGAIIANGNLVLPRHPPNHCCNSARCPRGRHRARSPRTTPHRRTRPPQARPPHRR